MEKKSTLMFELKTTPGRTCIIDGKGFLFFSGYSYLGMNHVKEFIGLIKEGIDKYGVLFPSSRISNTRLKLYKEFENALSEITGTEDSVSFSSGYLAGKTIAEILSSYQNILIAQGTHPAISIEKGIRTNSINFYDWKNEIIALINSSKESEFVIVADAVNIFNAEIHDFSFLEKIDEHKRIICLIDDSHGIGIIGKDGAGIASYLPKKNNIDYIICYSLSKAFSIQGGAVSCSKHWADKLRSHANYSGSTSINPSLIHAFLNSKKIYDEQRKKLFQNISLLKKNLPLYLLKTDFNLPIFICREEISEEAFYKSGIIISSFGYPYPDSKKINRVIINALHTKDDVKKLCSK